MLMFFSQGLEVEFQKEAEMTLDPSLASVDVTQFDDPTSQIMVKVWNGETEDLEPLLQKQVLYFVDVHPM